MPPPATHNPNTDARLLAELFEVLGAAVTVSVEGSIPRGYTFNLRCSLQQDGLALHEKHAAIYSRGQRDNDPLSLLMALGTLFRAIGRRQGVKYHIDNA